MCVCVYLCLCMYVVNVCVIIIIIITTALFHRTMLYINSYTCVKDMPEGHHIFQKLYEATYLFI